MDTSQLISLLGWCSVLNFSLLLIWSGVLLVWSEGVYALNTRFIPLEKDSFFKLHYGLLGAFKLMIYFFNLMPYLVLKYLL
jgi:hypothetical protein